MLTGYQTRETVYQVVFFIFFYFVFLSQVSTNGLFYTTHLVDVLLIILFFYFQKVFINFFQTGDDKLIPMSDPNTTIPIPVD